MRPKTFEMKLLIAGLHGKDDEYNFADMNGYIDFLDFLGVIR